MRRLVLIAFLFAVSFMFCSVQRTEAGDLRGNPDPIYDQCMEICISESTPPEKRCDFGDLNYSVEMTSDFDENMHIVTVEVGRIMLMHSIFMEYEKLDSTLHSVILSFDKVFADYVGVPEDTGEKYSESLQAFDSLMEELFATENSEEFGITCFLKPLWDEKHDKLLKVLDLYTEIQIGNDERLEESIELAQELTMYKLEDALSSTYRTIKYKWESLGEEY